MTIASDVRALLNYSIRATLIMCVIGAAACGLFVSNMDWLMAALSIFYGAFVALLGLYWIACTASGFDHAGDSKKRGTALYFLRYLMYGVLLAVGAISNLPIIGMLAGVMMQKASLMLYAWQSRKGQA